MARKGNNRSNTQRGLKQTLLPKLHSNSIISTFGRNVIIGGAKKRTEYATTERRKSNTQMSSEDKVTVSSKVGLQIL